MNHGPRGSCENGTVRDGTAGVEVVGASAVVTKLLCTEYSLKTEC